LNTHVRKLNVEERTIIRKMDLNPKYFVRIAKGPDYFDFLETTSGKILTVRR